MQVVPVLDSVGGHSPLLRCDDLDPAVAIHYAVLIRIQRVVLRGQVFLLCFVVAVLFGLVMSCSVKLSQVQLRQSGCVPSCLVESS